MAGTRLALRGGLARARDSTPTSRIAGSTSLCSCSTSLTTTHITDTNLPDGVKAGVDVKEVRAVVGIGAPAAVHDQHTRRPATPTLTRHIVDIRELHHT